MRKISAALLIAVVALSTSLFLASNIRLKTMPGGERRSDNSEIREYHGKTLSSIRDFRENSIKGPQKIDLNNYRLSIDGLVRNQMNFTYAEVLERHEHQERVMTMDCVEGWSVTLLWEGILVRDLLKEASPLPTAEIIIFHAADGYTTSLPLDYVIDREAMLAYKMNRISLPEERGFPFQLTAEGKWGYKWMKWVARIELSDDVNYRGFWENRGY